MSLFVVRTCFSRSRGIALKQRSMARRCLSPGSVAAVLVLLAVTSVCTVSGAGAEKEGENGGRRVLGDWKKEQEADRVVLPEQPAVKFSQYAGMVSVDATAGREFFYFFVESSKRASKKPVTLWLNGGPGCSSLADGFAEEFGPYRILPQGSGVYLDDHAWNRESNMLFLESPSGVGFSFSKNMSDNEEGGDGKTAHDNYMFLLNWFERFPQFKGRDFYIAGESYAGHYVPQLAKLIVDSNPGAKVKINLKGILAGNPTTDLYWDNVGRVDYLHSHAMISDQTWEGIKRECNFSDPNCCSKECNDLEDHAWNNEIADINPYSIYDRTCEAAPIGTTTVNRKGRLSVQPNNPFMRASSGYDPCGEDYSIIYFNRPEVQKALHANVSGVIPYHWTGCRLVPVEPRGIEEGTDVQIIRALLHNEVLQNWTDSDISMIPVYKALIKAGLKIWVFSGDTDAIVSVTATRYAIAAMKLKIKNPWQAWYHHRQVGGRVVDYEGLTFVTIRGAGHEVPLLQAARALHMFKTFLAAKSLPKTPYQ